MMAPMTSASAATGRRRYDETAYRCAHVVLSDYSTSFGAGARLLDRPTRRHIDAIYALVRVADEIVDTVRGPDAADMLAALRAETDAALARGWSANLVVHAFALTARRVGITGAETDPFFDSMATDLTVGQHDRESVARYIYGSAEVVGVMCLRAFLNAHRPPGEPIAQPDDDVVAGARALGAAFQKVNFLRDIGDDAGRLGRDYFPESDGGLLDHGRLLAALDDIDGDLALARATLADLPPRPRAAVAATIALYTELFDDLSTRTPEEIRAERVRVADGRKVLVASRAVARTWLQEWGVRER